MRSPQRLVFGEVAERYDRSRPTYPDALIDDLLRRAPLTPGVRALEVGAGTGKATRLLAARGVSVLAIEPSPEMAAINRRAARPGTEIVESDFESFDPGGERFGLVYAAQSWHWVDQRVGYERARAALVDGGLLAVFWNRPGWTDSPVRRAISRAYRAHAPSLDRENPSHPDSRDGRRYATWDDDAAAAAGLEPLPDRTDAWELHYGAREYADLISTHSEIVMLDPGAREPLLDAVAAAIEGCGGRLTMPVRTRCRLARAVGEPG
ncbi:MAG: methyltransferase domain-containing protein [Solirubrobacterales bacterium]|nr:methyltransferase domain-containing protein [Solirubrobacterales bacterium]